MADPGNMIGLDFINKLLGRSQEIPDRSSDVPLSPTPPTASIPPASSNLPLSPQMSLNRKAVLPSTQELEDPRAIYLDMNDKNGNPVVVFSTTGELRSVGDFASALKTYNKDGYSPKGFVTLPAGEMQARGRVGFEESVGNFAREKLPATGRAIGTATGVSPLIALAERAGILPQGAGTSVRQTLGETGEAIGRWLGQQIDEPGEAGMAAGTAAASLVMPPVAATGPMPKLTTAAFNSLFGGIAGMAGSTAARAATGEDIEPEVALQDFGIAALAGPTQLITHFISKHIAGDMQEKVAKDIISTFKERFPVINERDDVLNIAFSSKENLNKLAQQLGSGLMDTVEKESKGLLDNIYNTLPFSPTVGQKVSLNGYARRLVEAQQKRLNAIGDGGAIKEASDLVSQRGESLIQEISKMYSPKVKNIGPTEIRVAQTLQGYRDSLANVEDGTRILHLIKESNGDLMKFAQMIRGDYQAVPGSQREMIGEILGQGRPLTGMPQPDAPQRELTGITKSIADIAQSIPGVKTLARLPSIARGPQTPWPAPGIKTSGGMSPGSIPMTPLVNFGAQEGGQAAIRSFLDREKNQ